jgi:hypothetical protein
MTRTGYVRSTDGSMATLDPADRGGRRTGPPLRVRVPDDLRPHVLAAQANGDYACFIVDEAMLSVIENLRL